MAKNKFKIMNRYFLTWTIDIEASSPEQAARKALDIQRDPNSSATVFDVVEHNTKKVITIDLEKT